LTNKYRSIKHIHSKGYQRLTVQEARLLPLEPPIVGNAVTSTLMEPYCVFMQDDNGDVSAIVYTMGPQGDSVLFTRTYWPGHADERWQPTKLATTPEQARWLLAERPMQMIALPESLVQSMYRGWTFSLTAATPE
jgi:hypothetical protein